MVHPSGRLLQYGSRIEVQVEDKMSVKNAKVHPKGISFTANNMALVYLLDNAGARSTSDTTCTPLMLSTPCSPRWPR